VERAAKVLADCEKSRAEIRQGHAEGLQARAGIHEKSEGPGTDRRPGGHGGVRGNIRDVARVGGG